MLQFFTFYLPIIVCVGWLILFILNFFFYEYRSNLYKLITNSTGINLNINKISILNVLPTLLIIFNIYNLFIFYLVTTYNSFSFIYLNNLILLQLFLLNLIINVILIFFYNFKLNLNIDFIIFLYFLILTSQTILLFNNLLNIFFSLEIVNMLIIYSFLNSINIKAFQIKNIFLNFWLIESCIYQFILNFIGSITFYIFYNHLIIDYYSVNLISLSLFSQLPQNHIVFYGLYLAFLLKFGIGPWLVYKIHMYKHFNLLTLLLYTIIYFLTILVFFLNLFFLYKFTGTVLFIIGLNALLIITFLCLIVHLYSYTNILVFMSLSSLINFILIIMQLTIIITMFK